MALSFVLLRSVSIFSAGKQPLWRVQNWKEGTAGAVMNINPISDFLQKLKMKIGLCRQAPSDLPEFTRFLVEQVTDSISLNADALLVGIENIRWGER